jgi:hypothetical protein
MTNGFKDLRADLFVPETELDAYERLARVANVSRDDAKCVALALGYNAACLKARLDDGRRTGDGCRVFDVSKNPHCGLL